MDKEEEELWDDGNKETPQPARETQPSAKGEGAPVGRKHWVRNVCMIVLALVIAGVGAVAGWLGAYYSVDPRMRELQWLLDALETQHYKEVDLDEVYDALYDAVMPDIFSAYYTEEEYALIVEESQGTNRGIGISVVQQTDAPALVYTVVENSPAQRAGLKKGMYLFGCSAVGEAMREGGADEIMAFIDAQEGDFCLWAGYEKDAAQASPYTMRREVYNAGYCVYRDSEVSYARRDGAADGALLAETFDPLAGLDEDTAYIRLDSFDGQCADEFAACMDVFKARGKTDLILDLRGNGGGYLNDLQHIASFFTKDTGEAEPVVAYAEYRSGTRFYYTAAGNWYDDYFTESSEITVLADEGSASASECLIGAMIDYGAIGYEDIYLRKDEGATDCSTYGKGVMQAMLPSPQGGVFQLTVARIFWPVSGKCIHERGVRESDGANGVVAPYLPGETDVMLGSVVAAVCP